MLTAVSKRIVVSGSSLARNFLSLIVLISLVLSGCGPQGMIDPRGVTGLDTAALQTTVTPDPEDDYVPPEYTHPEPVIGERPETGEQLSVSEEINEDSYEESWGDLTNTIVGTPSPESPLRVESTPGPAQSNTQSFLQSLDAVEPTPADADCSDGECVFWVKSSTDDAGPDPSCVFYTGWYEIYLGKCTNGQGIVSGFRFPQVNIPKGSVIHEAYIEFTVDGPYSDSLDVTLYGEDKGYASSFSSYNRPSNRVLTEASANWQIPSTVPWVLGEIRNSPDLTDVVQEIIDRSDWNSGNALAIIVKDTSAAGSPNYVRRVIGYDRQVWYPGVDHAARLVVRVGSLVSDGSVQNSCNGVNSMGDCIQSKAANTQGGFGRPINTRTGGLFYQTEDMSVPTSGSPLIFNRTYSSLATDLYASTLGYGWTHSLESSLIFPDDPGGEAGYVLVKLHSANQYQFIINANGSYRPAPGISGALVHSSEVYTLTLPDQSVYTFDADGQLQTWADAEGHTWTYSYDVNDRLEEVNADSGTRYLSISYDAQGRIVAVADHTERSIVFAYDTNGDLVSMTDAGDEEWEYEYDAAHRLTRVLDPLGNTMERTEYDEQGRAVRQLDGMDNLIGELTYNADGTTTITDVFENSQTHTYDVSHTLSGESDTLGGTTNKTYDLNFRPRTITDVDGDVTTLTWSTDGTNLKQVTDAEGGQTDITYNALNNPASVIDPLDYLTTYEYDGTRLTRVTDALEGETTYTYTPEGYLESVSDPEGDTTSYSYDSHGQRISMTDPLEKEWTYSYDDLGRLVDTTDPLDRVMHNEYDTAGRLIRVTQNYDPNKDPNEDNVWNIVTEYSYDARSRQTSVTDTFGRVTSYEYDAEGRLLKTIDPDENETTNVYDEAGRLISTTDALDHTTTYAYDDGGRLISTTDALNHTTSTTYNPDGTVASATDVLDRTTSYTYDDLKRVLTLTQPGGGTTHNTYDAAGNLIAVTNVLGNTTEYEYDAVGHLIKTTDPLDGVTENFYDDAGRLIQTKDARGKATTYAYDEVGRQVSVTDALGKVTSYEYDDLGRRTAVVDAAENRTEYTYDMLDRVIAVKDPLGHFTYTEYDALGQVLSRTDANGNAVTFEYDNLGRVLSQTDALDGETTFTYDVVGNRLTTTDARESTTTITYDELNRPVVVIDPLENSSTTTYDAAGQVITIMNALDEETVYGYNTLGQQTSVTDPLENVTRYTYDLAGRVSSMQDANNIVTSYEYDALGRLTAVVENFRSGVQPTAEINVRTEYTYDANGNRLTIKDGNHHITNFAYDNLNRLIRESDALEHTWSYEYDELGNRISMTDANGNTTVYSYDDANRLGGVDAAGTEADVSFNYDAGGRRIQMTDAIGATSWTYDELNRPVAITDSFETEVSYAYDPVGNRTELSYDGQTVNYVYNALNQLSEVSGSGLPDSVQYGYDAAGRIQSVSRPNGVITTYSYFGNGWLQDITHSVESDPLASYQYQYDGVGNRVQAIEDVNLPAIQPPTETPTPTPTFTATPTLTPTVTPTVTPGPDVVHDEFDGSQLGADWEWYVPMAGPTYSLAAELDHLQLVVPPDRDHWVDTDTAPQIRRSDMGSGDWALETYFELDDTNAGDQWQINLMAGFDQYDQQWLSIDSDNILTVTRVGESESAIEYEISLPIYLRIEKSGTQYTFKYKQNVQDPWTTLDIQTISTTVSYVGLQTRTFYESAGDLVLNMDYFRLERSNQPDPEPVIVHDEFDGSLLGVDWEWYVPMQGPAYSLSAEPDHLQLVVPPAREHWVDTDTAPQVRRRDMGSGDWSIETYLALDDTNAGDQWQINLMAGFDRYDQQWISIYNDNTLSVMRVGEDDTAVVYEISLPLYLRVEKSGSQYTFKYKENTEDPWTALDTQTITTDVSYVGLQTRTFYDSAGDLVLNVDYFRLERSSQPDPGPEKEIELDEFDQPTLNADWTWYVPKAGPTYSLSAVNDALRMTLPQQDSFEHWIDTDEAPQLQRTDLGTGDWAIEAELENISAAVDAGYWAALHVGFDQYDQIWYGKDDSGGLKSIRVGEGEYFAIEGLDLPLTLRLEKHGEEYTFKYRQNAGEAWTVTAPYLFSGTPAYVGLIARSPDTGSEDLQVDWSYFRIERWDAQQGLMTMEDSLNVKPLPEQNETPQPSQPLRTPTPTHAPTRTPTRTPTPTVTPSPSIQGMDAPFYSLSEAPEFAANFVPASYKLPASYQQSSSVTITYDYDPLYRLKEANYSTGDTYHYGYDAVGNRLTQDTQVGAIATTTNYLYDDANRVQSVNGVTYTFDANGNLLDDGINTYTYDSANRLKTLNSGSVSASYSYSGLGDRLQETVNGNTTTFTMDLNTGLTQALSDGTNHYIYGLDRIAQVNSATEYFLGDALRSVRQLTDANAEITYAGAYDPYGVVTTTVGAAQSAYGYTNEYNDSYIKLIYLRSRMYDPQIGRFTTRDSWQGDYNRPRSLNRWMYVEGDPINHTDPSGYITEKESKRAELILAKLDQWYDVQIKKDWGKRPIPLFSSLPPSVTSYPDGCYWEEGNWRSLDELEWTLQAVKDFTKAFGPQKGLFSTAMRWQPVRIDRIPTKYIFDSGAFTTILTNVILPNDVFDSRDEKWAKGQIVHELAHVMDYRQIWPPSRLSNGMAMLTKSFKEVCQIGRGGVQVCNLVYDPMGENESPPSLYAQNNPQEDWAESFKFFIYPSFGDLEQIREDYIKDVIWDLKTP